MTVFEDNVLGLFEKHRAEWLAKARDVARKLGESGRIVTIDDVRDLCPPPGEVDPRVMGAVFLRKEWERCGYTSGKRMTSHARPVSQFKLKEYEGAKP